jgi:3-oxoacyl-[acyl-carrier protein] reductase
MSSPVARLDGRVAVVTGAGRGFGRAIALALGRAGADVVVNYRRSAVAAETLADEIRALGRRAVVHQGDISEEAAARGVVAAAVESLGAIDVLVNNAGVMVRGPFLEVPVSAYDEMFRINVMGTMWCTRFALEPMMARRYGRIVNLSSQLGTVGSVGSGGFAGYAATKAAIEAFTKAIAHDFGAYGITANVVAPGGIETDMSRDVMTPEYRARRLAELPLRRFGSVDDVAYSVLVLAAEEAGYLTGQTLHPSGGWVMP